MTEENNKQCNNTLGKFKTQEEIDMAYQQLARLEQDSKQLTQWLDEARNNADFWCNKCTNLEQENNSLQAQLNNITVQSNNAITALEQENKDLKKQIESDKGLITVGGKQQYKYLQEIDKLQQENKELKAYKDVNEDFKKAWDELNEKHKRYRSALESIRDYLNTLTTVDSDFPNTETYLRIQNTINEVLNEEKL